MFSGGGEGADESEALLSHWLWQGRFQGRGDIAGRQIVLNRKPYRIVGVMPASFAFPERDTAAWTAFRIRPVVDPAHPETHNLSMFSAIGRLRAGVTADQASAEGTARVRAAPDPGLVGEAVFGVKGPGVVLAVPLLSSLTADVRPALLVLMAGVGLLLAVATGNVALLQLARSTTRAREIAIRAAIGADSRRLARQMLVESAAVGLVGGTLALLIAGWLHRALPALLPEGFPRLAEVALDWRVASFAVMVALVTSATFGMVPALQARRIDLAGTLAEDGSAPIGGGIRSSTARVRLAVMAGQVAVACVLLIGAVLLLRSFVALSRADRGYDAGNLLTARLPMPATSYTDLQRAALLSRVVDRLRGMPAVREAAAAGSIPLGHGYTLSALTMTRRDGTPVTIRALQRIVSPDYFAALGIRPLEGRVFTGSDTLTSGSVMVVNRAFAAQYFGSDTVGTRIPVRFNADRPGATIVGIVDNVRYGSVTDNAEPEYYISTAQMSGGMPYEEPYLVVRTRDDPARFVPDLRGIVKDEDPLMVLESVSTMEDRVSASIARPRLYTLLLCAFAGFALAIAGVGLFGTLSYIVAHRSKELAVRSALGATPADVAGLVLAQALLVIGCGAAAGVAAAAFLVRLLSTLLYGIGAHDAFTFVLVPVGIALAAALACAVPARRAARIDPLRLLK
jgi:predicted permease